MWFVRNETCDKIDCVKSFFTLFESRSVVGLVVRISAFQADGPGSIPGRRSNLFRRYVRLCEESPQNAQFLEFSMLGWLVVLPSSVMLGLMHLPSLLGCKGSCVHRKLEVGFPGGRVAQWIRRRSSEPKIVGSSPTVVILASATIFTPRAKHQRIG